MQNKKYTSRTEKQMKRRKNERLIYSLIGVAVLFLIILLIFIFSGNNKGDDQKTNSSNEEEIAQAEADDEADDSVDEFESMTEIAQSDKLPDDTVIQQIDSDDNNVIEAFVGNWPVIETSQEEPHTVNYDDNSQDRIEIKEAILLVTNISEDDLIEHWVGNGGDQKVIATVENRSNNNYYRIYLSWIENEGWQVTLVERIKEIDNP